MTETEAEARMRHARAWLGMATTYRDALRPLYAAREISSGDMYAAEKEVLDAQLAYDLARAVTPCKENTNVQVPSPCRPP